MKKADDVKKADETKKADDVKKADETKKADDVKKAEIVQSVKREISNKYFANERELPHTGDASSIATIVTGFMSALGAAFVGRKRK